MKIRLLNKVLKYSNSNSEELRNTVLGREAENVILGPDLLDPEAQVEYQSLNLSYCLKIKILCCKQNITLKPNECFSPSNLGRGGNEK